MAKRSQDNDHLDHNELLERVRAVEDLFKDENLIEATPEQMTPVWELTKPIKSRSMSNRVSAEQYGIIAEYTKSVPHIHGEKAVVVQQLGMSYSWLTARMIDYRMGRLGVKE